MFPSDYWRRWSYDFDVFEPVRDFDKYFYHDLEILRQNHLKRMRDLSFFRPRYFERNDYYYKESNYFKQLNIDNFDHLNRFDSNLIKPIFSPKYSKLNSTISENYQIRVDCKGYSADSIKLTISEDKQSITISAQEENKYENNEDYSFKKFRKVFRLPTNADILNIKKYWELDGYLVLDIPLSLSAEFDSKTCESNNLDTRKTVTFEEKPLFFDEEKSNIKKIKKIINHEIKFQEFVSNDPFENIDNIFKRQSIFNEEPRIKFNEEISFIIPIN